LKEARRLYGLSLAIERDLGDRPGEAISLWGLALVDERQGRLRLAVRQMEKAAAMLEEMGHVEKHGARAELKRMRKRLT
jgi:hypothetical protein